MNEMPGLDLAATAFTLNGRAVTCTAAPDKRLADVLREDFGMTGTKVGCDAGDCGACTVLLDGRQVCACLVPLAQATGAAVETVESFGDDGGETALQRSFLHHGAAQCGICTPGMLMAATELLRREPRPDGAEVRDALGGVLCRCTGYGKIVEAVMDAHRFEDAANTAVDTDGPAVGARHIRVDGAAKVSGRDLFGADAAPADSLWLRVLRSPHARARYEIGDLDAIRASHPGIVAILTTNDIPGTNRFGIYPDLKDQPVLAEGVVRYRGDAVLALVGEKTAIETFDMALLPVDWFSETPVAGIEAALAAGAPAIHDDHPDNILTRGRLETGDAASALAAAVAMAEGNLRTGFVEHAYIEPEAGFAKRVGDRIEVTACTQAPHMDLDETAHVLGVARDAVRIIPTGCGGGFGGKLDVSLQPLLAVAAWTLNRPVRCIYNRIESMASSTKRHPATIAASAAADRQGNLTALRMTADFDTGAYASWGPTVAGRVPVHASGPYRVPNVSIRSRAIYSNAPPSGAFRGFGVPQTAIIQERLFDDLAESLSLDPFEFRYRNALRPGDRTATGQVLSESVGLTECLEKLRPRWEELRRQAEDQNAARAASPRRRGVGVGCMWYGCGNTSMSNPSEIRVALDRKGGLTLFNGAVDIGQGSYTVILQICADALGLPLDRFRLVVGDTDLTPDAGKTSASRQTFVSGRAAFLAGRDLRAQFLRLANAGEEATLELGQGQVTIRDEGRETVIDLGALPALDDRDNVLLGIGAFDPPTTALDENGQGDPYASYAFAAQIADLEVDIELGTVHLHRIVAAHDVGRAINPTLVEGQIHGGIAQGIGLALMEEYVPGRTENLHDYLIPTMGDVPEIEVMLVEAADPLGPFGAKGIGEPALVPTAPAIFGAIRHATGVRASRVPLLPHRLLAALQEAG